MYLTCIEGELLGRPLQAKYSNLGCIVLVTFIKSFNCESSYRIFNLSIELSSFKAVVFIAENFSTNIAEYLSWNTLAHSNTIELPDGSVLSQVLQNAIFFLG